MDGDVFQCQNCVKVFNERRRYNQHLKTHSKPFKCEKCSRGFGLRADLARHVRAGHRVAQPKYPCPYAGCKHKATRKDNLQQHKLKMHKQPIKPSKIVERLNIQDSERIHSTQEEISQTEAHSTEQKKNSGSPSNLLFSAAAAGNIALLEQLRRSGVDIHILAEDGSNVLHAAANAGHESATRYLLELGVSSETRNHKSETPFHEAARSGSWSVMKTLCEDNMVEFRRKFRKTSAGECILESGDHQSIRNFIDHFGQQVINSGPYCLLYKAIRLKNSSLVDLLLSYPGLYTDEGSMRKSSAPVHRAVRCGNADVLRSLLSCKTIEIDASSMFSPAKSALQMAIKFGHQELVQILISDERIRFKDYNLWPKDEIECSVRARQYKIGLLLIRSYRIPESYVDFDLLQAVIDGEESEVARLLRRPRLTSHSHATVLEPLNWAVALGRISIVKLLLLHPDTDVNLGQEHDFLPLDIAAHVGDQVVLEMLLDHPNINYKMGKPLYWAVKRKDSNMVEILLRFPIEVNQNSPLRVALKHQSFQLAERLIQDQRINVNQGGNNVNQRLSTFLGPVLHVAVDFGNIDIVRSILTREVLPKVEINRADLRGTALDVALEKSHADIADLLRAYGAKSKAELARGVPSTQIPDSQHTFAAAFPTGRITSADSHYQRLW